LNTNNKQAHWHKNPLFFLVNGNVPHLYKYRLKVFAGCGKAIWQNQYIYLDRRLESEKQIKCRQTTQNVFSIWRHFPERPNIVKVTQIPSPAWSRSIAPFQIQGTGLVLDLDPLPIWFWPNRFTLCCRQPFAQPGCKYVQRLNVSNKASVQKDGHGDGGGWG